MGPASGSGGETSGLWRAQTSAHICELSPAICLPLSLTNPRGSPDQARQLELASPSSPQLASGASEAKVSLPELFCSAHSSPLAGQCTKAARNLLHRRLSGRVIAHWPLAALEESGGQSAVSGGQSKVSSGRPQLRRTSWRQVSSLARSLSQAPLALSLMSRRASS